MQKSVNLQDIFLNTVRREHIQVTVFLTNGFQMRGTIRAFDNFAVLFDSDGHQNLIYKHAISTICPSKELELNLNLPVNESCLPENL